jgi:threonine synthase
VPGVEVVSLYPSGKVSSVQEKQLTTLGKNIHALEVNGNFDNCQQLVKQAFSDFEINQKLFLTSANSINVARWLPQQFYYFLAWKQWPEKKHPPVISVPSGNFGNICAAILAHVSGLPVQHFIAACNVNDTVPQFLKTGSYQAEKNNCYHLQRDGRGRSEQFCTGTGDIEEDISELRRICPHIVLLTTKPGKRSKEFIKMKNISGSTRSRGLFIIG